MSKFKQGTLLTEDILGYNGRKTKIELRSSYEFKAISMFIQLYKIKRIEGFSSEESVFEYIYSLDQKKHRYFMDFTIETKNNIFFVEIKPKSQTFPPKKPSNFKNEKQKRRYDNEMSTYIKNMDKWNSVKNWCEKNNTKIGREKYIFKIFTEKELSIS